MKRWHTKLLARAGLCVLAATLFGCSGYADQPRAKSGVEAYGVIDVGVTSRR